MLRSFGRTADKDNSGALQDYEFASCLSALGHNVAGPELNAVTKKYDTSGDGKITFDEFVAFMVDQVQDVDSADQILQSFEVLAGGKDYVSEADLRSGKLSEEEIAYCVGNMPLYNGEEGCFDFKAFTQSVYA
jgi:actinin alpha 1/4